MGKAYMTERLEPEQNEYTLGDYRFTPSFQTLEYLPKGETANLSHREVEILRRLCRALSKDPRIRIVNVRGTGYKLIAE